MKQTYTKEQHEFASDNQQALVTIAWDGKHLPKPGGAAIFAGPVNAAELKQIQALFGKIAKRKASVKRW